MRYAIGRLGELNNEFIDLTMNPPLAPTLVEIGSETEDVAWISLSLPCQGRRGGGERRAVIIGLPLSSILSPLVPRGERKKRSDPCFAQFDSDACFMKRSLSLWMRDLHLYAGLFASPFILIFAVSTILLNHAWKTWTRAAVEKTTAPVEIPAGLKSGAEGVPAAKQILRQVNVSGEIGFVRHQPQNNRLIIPVFKPGQRITIDVDLTTRTAAIERTGTDLWSTLIYLHRTPGPHNAQAPRNWVFTQAWGWLADATIYLLLFLSASGVYLWALLKAERKIGLILIGTGVLSFIVLVSVLAR